LKGERVEDLVQAGAGGEVAEEQEVAVRIVVARLREGDALLRVAGDAEAEAVGLDAAVARPRLACLVGGDPRQEAAGSASRRAVRIDGPPEVVLPAAILDAVQRLPVLAVRL